LRCRRDWIFARSCEASPPSRASAEIPFSAASASPSRPVADDRSLDLDNLGAQVRHQLGGVGGGDHVANFYDSETG